jgi:hypothetical protein
VGYVQPQFEVHCAPSRNCFQKKEKTKNEQKKMNKKRKGKEKKKKKKVLFDIGLGIVIVAKFVEVFNLLRSKGFAK